MVEAWLIITLLANMNGSIWECLYDKKPWIGIQFWLHVVSVAIIVNETFALQACRPIPAELGRRCDNERSLYM